jgi:hypothetical protein
MSTPSFCREAPPGLVGFSKTRPPGGGAAKKIRL